MINFIGIWLITILISIISDKIFLFEAYKLVANYGYKSKCDNIYELPQEIISVSKEASLIPIFNVLARMYGYAYVKYNLTGVIQALIDQDIIEEMTDEEKIDYEKNHNMFHAVAISLKSIDKIQTIEMMIDGAMNRITYRVSNDSKELEILEVEGPLKERKLTKKQLEKVIFNRWMELFTLGPKLQPNKFEKMLAKSQEFTLTGITSEENEKRDLDVTDIRFYYNIEELSKLNDYYDKEFNNERVKVKRKEK